MPCKFDLEDSRRRKGLLQRLMAHRGAKCAYCSTRLDPRQATRAPTLDEQTPRWMGGAEDEVNCVAACWDCNQRKGAMPADIFRAVRTLRGEAFRRIFVLWQQAAELRCLPVGYVAQGVPACFETDPKRQVVIHGGARRPNRRKSPEQAIWEEVYG